MNNTGGPAFPVPYSNEADGPTVMPTQGMTLRDYFAARAMHGLMGRNWSHHTGTDEELIAVWARSAYSVADAMLKEREQ